MLISLRDNHTTIVSVPIHTKQLSDECKPDLKNLIDLRDEYVSNFQKTFKKFRKTYGFSCYESSITYPDKLCIPDSYYTVIDYTLIKIYCHEELYLKFNQLNKELTDPEEYYNDSSEKYGDHYLTDCIDL